METYTRYLQTPIFSALEDTPVVVVVGPRQAGKSTLAKQIQKRGGFSEYYTLDDPTTLYAAKTAPLDFLSASQGNLIIDEVQRAPELFLPMKKIVDAERRPGRFLLTGSANVLNLPKIADSLAGRMEVHTLWPLSQSEIYRRPEQFLDLAFSQRPPKDIAPIAWSTLVRDLIVGGYPDVLSRQKTERRLKWYNAYMVAMLQRDIRELASLEGLTEIPNLLTLLANRAANLINYADISRMTGMSATTLKRYIALLGNTFLTVMLPAWSTHLEKRIIKTPKVFINDVGLLCYLCKLSEEKLLTEKTVAGPVLENFVVMELFKQKGWYPQLLEIYHFRNHSGNEVDVVLEDQDGRLVGLEIKASSTVKDTDFKGLNVLKTIAGKHFHRGFVLYVGEKIVPFGPDLWAIPISALWH